MDIFHQQPLATLIKNLESRLLPSNGSHRLSPSQHCASLTRSRPYGPETSLPSTSPPPTPWIGTNTVFHPYRTHGLPSSTGMYISLPLGVWRTELVCIWSLAFSRRWGFRRSALAFWRYGVGLAFGRWHLHRRWGVQALGRLAFGVWVWNFCIWCFHLNKSLTLTLVLGLKTLVRERTKLSLVLVV